MSTRFLSGTLWARLRQLARANRATTYVAVPFIGPGAVKRLPLRKGDVLITRFHRDAVRSGLVDPREVIKYLRRRVEVHSVSNLHAKVFVFGRRAVVGSANLSATSERFLIEAACEFTDRSLVKASREFISSLRGEVVEPEFARRQVRYYKPPRVAIRPSARHVRRAAPEQTVIVAVRLQEIEFDDTDERAAREASTAARKRMAKGDRFKLDSFRWTGAILPGLRPGNRVLICDGRGRTATVTAPGRILVVRRYRSRRGASRALVVVELRKYVRERRLQAAIDALGGPGQPLRHLRNAKQLKDPKLLYALGQLWPNVS